MGGQKFGVKSNKWALIQASHQDFHFTLLGFSNALGQPVCCVMIIAATQVTAKDIIGLQPWAETIGDPELDFEENSHGLDKYYPYDPTCSIFSKTIPTFVTCSESGSITSNILMDVLKHIDHSIDWDQSEVNHSCIGVPYGTNLWQVGDSTQQNGVYKSWLTLEKKLLLEKDSKGGLTWKLYAMMLLD